VHDGVIAVREYLNLTISFDHDIVDGAPAARFARTLVELIEKATVLEEVAMARPSNVESASIDA
jgi:pyruvate/2-oxoglutarate dehydrogenase complex dihydrolipoamide acyltransferase (E2) component